MPAKRPKCTAYRWTSLAYCCRLRKFLRAKGEDGPWWKCPPKRERDRLLTHPRLHLPNIGSNSDSWIACSLREFVRLCSLSSCVCPLQLPYTLLPRPSSGCRLAVGSSRTMQWGLGSEKTSELELPDDDFYRKEKMTRKSALEQEESSQRKLLTEMSAPADVLSTRISGFSSSKFCYVKNPTAPIYLQNINKNNKR